MSTYYGRNTTRTLGYALESANGTTQAFHQIGDRDCYIKARIGDGDWANLGAFIASYSTGTRSGNVVCGATPGNLEISVTQAYEASPSAIFVLPSPVVFVAGNTYAVSCYFEFDTDMETDWVTIYFGTAAHPLTADGTYGSSAVPPPVIVTHPSDTSNRTLAQSTQFTASATGATSSQWQRSINGGSSYQNITGQTTDTLTIEAAGHGYKYRCAYTNAYGTTYTNAATLGMSASVGTVETTAENFNAYIATIGAALTVTGRVTGTANQTFIIDNPALVITGVGMGTSIEAYNIYFEAFQTIQDLEYLKASALTNGFRFTSTADFSGITDPSIERCGLDGYIYFGDKYGSDRSTSLGDPATLAAPNMGGFLIEDCTLPTARSGISGCFHGTMTWRRLTGAMVGGGISGKCISLGGDKLIVDDCDIETTFAEGVMKPSAHWGYGKSILGWEITNSRFAGGHEENFGVDEPVPTFSGHVAAVGTDSLTVVVDHSPSGHDQLGSAGLVGRHVMVNNGLAFGNYYLITAQSVGTTPGVYDVLTLDVSRFANKWPEAPALSDVAVDDRITVAAAMVDMVFGGSEATKNTIVLKRGFRDRGYGCNHGLSLYGNCYGNGFSYTDFQFPTPLELCTGLPAHNPPGPDIVAADYAVAIQENAIVTPDANGASGCNTRNKYDHLTADPNIPVFITAQGILYSGESPEAIHPVTYGGHDADYSFGIQVTNCTYGESAICEINAMKEMVWGGNTTVAPSTNWTGLTPHDYTASQAAVFPYTQYDAYYQGGDGFIEFTGLAEDDWMWEWHLGTGASGTTWALTAPTNVVAIRNGAQVDVTFDDYAGNDGIRWKRKEAGGVYGDPVTIAQADVTSFTDSSASPVKSYVYAVSVYNADRDSAWVESNTLTTATAARRRYVLLDPFAPTRL